ncbi:RHS repeat-associated core domain-containing protein [Cognatiyoonia koreensis]|uniref:RHS repeat-associated core domain-containing protein n=1 Tax=Cognatiyoonia koreensis TaxID=364200 RepID=A0A1I0RLR2_9RHOB|nr:RHS repeat-associated core domain-containing protein [Cognatiyoonia koreensis]SEW42161.1 RHS repeat-associated core domain-containing protein [Cognatiyoonia koreensis]
MGILAGALSDPGLNASRVGGTVTQDSVLPTWDGENQYSQEFGRNGFERNYDNLLNVAESPVFNYGIAGGVLGYSAVAGGMAASAAGTGVAAGALMGAAPIAIAVGAGWVGAKIGVAAGDALGHTVMSRIPGFERLPENGEMPATMGMEIAHTSRWATLGALVVGAVAAVVVGGLIAATGGLAMIALGALAGGFLAGLGAGFASAAGQYGSYAGTIAKGSTNVFFNNKPVARVTDLVACTRHSSSPHACATGAETVFANSLPIARIGNKTTCDATINDGCPDIAIDIDISTFALDIDRGWDTRITRTFLVALNFVQFPRPKRTSNVANAVDSTPALTRTTYADPIDVATGQLTDVRTDFSIPGTIPLELTRSYAPKATGLLGRGWASSWGQHLRVDGPTFVYQDPDGVNVTFYVPDERIDSSNLRMPHLEMMGQKSKDIFLYDRREQLFYIFGWRDGDRILLTGIEDRNKNRISFGYDKHGLKEVVHSDGFALDVMSENGLMRTVAVREHPDGDCVVNWDYSRAGQLTEVRSAQKGTLKYNYDEKGRIVRWADAKATEVYYEYDHSNRIERSWSSSGHMGALLDHHPEERFTIATNSAGHQTVFHYNADGLVTREIDALGGEWLTEWNNQFSVTKRVDPLGNTSTYSFDDYGNMTSAEDPSGAKLEWTYDEAGLLISRKDANGSVETFNYDDKGNVRSVTDALGGEIAYRRGEKGEILRVELPGGGQERVYYDHMMRPRMFVSGDGHESRMRYDVEGRLTMMQDGEGQVIKYDVTRGPQNPRGTVRQIRMPDGSTSHYQWDIEGQLASFADAEGQTSRYDFGAFDLPISATDAAGKTITLEHDREMRLTAVINAAGERYEYKYDAVGALIVERDFSGLVTRYERDKASRVIRKIAPDGIKTDYSYSERGDLIEMRIADAVTRFEYDACGRMTLAENRDAKVEYVYDALGRVKSEKLNGREVKSDYAASSGLRIARSGDVLPLESSYSNGGLLKDLRVSGHDSLRFQYDKRGLEVLRQSAAGFAMAQGYTPNAQLKTQIVGHIDQLPNDARQGMVSVSTRYDASYGAVARAYRSYDWDKAGRAVGITDARWGETRMGYDPRGQVSATQHIDKSGYEVARAHFAYDATKNITAIQTAKGQDDVKSSPGGRVLSRGRAFYRYDACGRVIEKRVEEPGFRPKTWAMQWDGECRLVRLTTPDGAVWAYGYDALGRRIRRLKLVAGASEESDAPGYLPPGAGRAYQWDGDQIAAEAPVYADGTIAWDQAESWVYEPGTFLPVAKILGDELYYVVTDHIGTPRELVTEDGKRAAWRARIGLWGDIQDQQVWKTPKAANDDHAPLTCNIRFQGQWYDEESGLHYNRFRYYDPEATQYLTPDPIGLEGGTRPQGYVSDPNTWIDPLGLAGCVRFDHNAGRWRDTRGRFAKPPVAGADVTTVGTQHQGRFPTTQQAPNTVMYRADANGNVTHYQVWGTDGLPSHRVDITGAAHGGVSTPHVVHWDRNTAPNGNVFANKRSDVRPAFPSELP